MEPEAEEEVEGEEEYDEEDERGERAKKMKRKSDFIVVNHFMLNLLFIDDSIQLH